jgi:hypothetical protein
MLASETAILPVAWRVEFHESSDAIPDGVDTIEVLEPRTVTALLIPMEPSDALAQAHPQATGALTVIWMPQEVNTPATIERDVDEWTRRADSVRKEVNVRADVRNLRVVWGESRSVIYANEGDLRFALDAVIRFSVAQGEALALESAMRSTWNTIEADTALTHALTMADLKRQNHVNQMTEFATRLKMTWLRIFRTLDQLDPPLTEQSKRVFAELVSAASLHDRMETLENPIQFALDHYEISNTRLIDMYLARTDRVNSIYGYGILIILLLIQTWLMLVEGGWIHFSIRT